MADTHNSVALSVFQTMFAANCIRAHPINSDAMEPTVYKGEIVGIIPCDRYEHEAIYVLHDPFDTALWRCQYHGGTKTIRCYQDNPVYGQVFELSVEEFAEQVLGRVVAVCGHVDRPRGVQHRRAA